MFASAGICAALLATFTILPHLIPRQARPVRLRDGLVGALQRALSALHETGNRHCCSRSTALSCVLPAAAGALSSFVQQNGLRSLKACGLQGGASARECEAAFIQR